MSQPTVYEFAATGDEPIYIDTRVTETCNWADVPVDGPDNPNVLFLFEGWADEDQFRDGNRANALTVVEDLTAPDGQRRLYVWTGDTPTSEIYDWVVDFCAELMVKTGRNIELAMPSLRK